MSKPQLDDTEPGPRLRRPSLPEQTRIRRALALKPGHGDDTKGLRFRVPNSTLEHRSLGSLDRRDYPITKQTHPSTAERGDPRTRKLRSPFSLEGAFHGHSSL